MRGPGYERNIYGSGTLLTSIRIRMFRWRLYFRPSWIPYSVRAVSINFKFFPANILLFVLGVGLLFSWLCCGAAT
jgi:hypothetical protein